MTRIVLFLLAVLVAASGLSWLADRPGHIAFDWEGYKGELSVFDAVVIFAFLTALAAFAWTILRQLWTSPASVGHFLMKRKQKRGLDALSSGMIAVGAGDRGSAMRYAIQARKTLPNEPLTHLLRAQAAQLTGDKATARRIFEAMLSSPDTEQLGLRGLYLEAARMKETEAARQFAERAVRLNPKLSWPVEALFDLQCKGSDWSGALETLAIARKNAQVDKTAGDRRRAVLLTAQAQALEESDSEKALTLALEAHGLAPSLVPAGVIAGRLLASRGNTPRAAKVLAKTWTKSPHPELAAVYAYARIGDSPRDRLERVKQLAALTPHTIESPIAVATTAIESRSFDDARSALGALLDGRLTQRVATLMARIEGEEHGDKGKVREWLARAINAPRDPAWTADGIVSDRWAPVSPVTGALDAFQWRVPVDDMQAAEGEELTTRLESLVALGATVQEAAPVFTDVPATVAAPPAASSLPVPSMRRATPVAVDVEPVDDVPRSRAIAPEPYPVERALPPDLAPPMEDGGFAEPLGRTKPAAAELADVEIRSGRTELATAAQDARTAAPEPELKSADARPVRGDVRPAARSDAKTKRKPESQRTVDPKIFVPPRAPDDPGLDTDEAPGTAPAIRPYRAN